MAYITLGIIGFGFFILYDINSVLDMHRVFRCCFFVGSVLLLISTGALTFTSAELSASASARTFVLIMCGFACIFFILLMYTLFFALPFKDTYTETKNLKREKKEEALPKVCSVGVYALCRHPGVLWFIGLFLFLGLAFPAKYMIAGGVAFCLCNLAYIILQDIWTFPKCFCDYEEYKKSVPFLIPTPTSTVACFKTLRGRESTCDLKKN